MKFSIVTPSFKQHDWLRLCVASVADQQGVDVEHIVQDGGDAAAREALDNWTSTFPTLRVFVEPDAGMYDAVNRGLRRATGEICAYLNCDEQYLPGALTHVHRMFERRPDLDLVFGDALVVDGTGGYVCHRQTLVPALRHTVACHFGILTCAIFFHRRLVDRGFLFDTSFRVAGDTEWMIRCLRAGLRLARTPHLLSVFTDTGANLGLDQRANEEMRRIQGQFPAWWSRLAPVWAAQHRLRRLLAGYYHPKRTRYAVYTLKTPERRTELHADRPTFLWKTRLRWDR